MKHETEIKKLKDIKLKLENIKKENAEKEKLQSDIKELKSELNMGFFNFFRKFRKY